MANFNFWRGLNCLIPTHPSKLTHYTTMPGSKYNEYHGNGKHVGSKHVAFEAKAAAEAAVPDGGMVAHLKRLTCDGQKKYAAQRERAQATTKATPKPTRKMLVPPMPPMPAHTCKCCNASVTASALKNWKKGKRSYPGEIIDGCMHCYVEGNEEESIPEEVVGGPVVGVEVANLLKEITDNRAALARMRPDDSIVFAIGCSREAYDELETTINTMQEKYDTCMASRTAESVCEQMGN